MVGVAILNYYIHLEADIFVKLTYINTKEFLFVYKSLKMLSRNIIKGAILIKSGNITKLSHIKKQGACSAPIVKGMTKRHFSLDYITLFSFRGCPYTN